MLNDTSKKQSNSQRNQSKNNLGYSQSENDGDDDEENKKNTAFFPNDINQGLAQDGLGISKDQSPRSQKLFSKGDQVLYSRKKTELKSLFDNEKKDDKH